MTTIALLIFVAVASSCLTAILRRPSDTEYIELVAKYADAASSLTSMRAKIDDLQEKLDFSDDVRNMLGIENAKLAEQIAVYEEKIGELKRDAERGEDARWALVEAITSASETASNAVDKIAILERSLCIARHKEFKQWKKLQSRFAKASDRLRYTDFGHGEFFEACQVLRGPGGTIKSYKCYVRRHAPFIKEVAPYPLP